MVQRQFAQIQTQIQQQSHPGDTQNMQCFASIQWKICLPGFGVFFLALNVLLQMFAYKVFIGIKRKHLML